MDDENLFKNLIIHVQILSYKSNRECVWNVYNLRLREKWTSLEAIAVLCASHYAYLYDHQLRRILGSELCLEKRHSSCGIEARASKYLHRSHRH